MTSEVLPGPSWGPWRCGRPYPRENDLTVDAHEILNRMLMYAEVTKAFSRVCNKSVRESLHLALE